MDARFPKYVQWLVRRLEFLAVPNLAILIGGLAVLAFFAAQSFGLPAEMYIFRPDLVLKGEITRLFVFPLVGGNSPIWLFFFVLYAYFVIGGLESAWGAGPLTVYVLISYVSVILGSFLFGLPAQVWTYVLLNITLAYGTVFPDQTFYIFFVIPVKAKWMAWLAGGLFALNLIQAPFMLYRLHLIFCIAPYFLFFGPFLYHAIRDRSRLKQHRERFDKDMWR